MISGVSLSGNLFFYPNCLESDGKYKFNQGSLTRKSWFDCSCCPSNVIRFIPSVPDYIYAHKDDSLYINLFVASKADIEMAKTNVEISQKTGYPWNQMVVIKVNPQASQKFSLHIRIPGWAMGKPVPSDLYRYTDEYIMMPSLKLNGKQIDLNMKKGYAVIDRTWSKGDVIEFFLPVAVRRVIANEKVKDDLNKVALVRGPIVYCAEWVDNDGKVLDMVIPDDTIFQTEFKKDMFNGVTVITGDILDESGNKRTLTAIPYYAWSHRGPGEMAVWLPRKPH